MNMLLRLYPRLWRERYGDEILAVLEAQPASLLDRIDLISGAFDAHLHPQVPGAAAPEKEFPVNHRLFGVMAAIGGLAWIIGFATLFVMPPDAYGDQESIIAFVGAMLAMPFIGIPLGQLGSRPESETSRRTGHVISLASLVTAGLMFIPWPVFVAGLYAFVLIGILAAVRGTQNGTFPRWYGITFLVAAIASIGGFLGGISQDAAVASMMALGLAGLGLAWVAFRGPAVGAQPSEVAAA